MFIAFATVSCKIQNPDDFSFGNKAFISTDSFVDNNTLKKSVKSLVRTIIVETAEPVSEEVRIGFAADSNLVSYYNTFYYDDAVALPVDNYVIKDNEAVIPKGSIRSTAVNISFVGLNLLPMDTTYVLPVTVKNITNIEILERSRTKYYVFKGGALINVVADLEDKNFISFPSFAGEGSANSSVLNNMRNCTLETLINVREFAPGIQSIMGIEGYYLLRISDNGLKPNQLQLVTPYGNMTSDKCMLPANKWINIAAVFNSDSQSISLYIDGVLAIEKTGLTNISPLSLGKAMGYPSRSFYIGFSYGKGRELNGLISECRIWNVAKSAEELLNDVYEVSPDASGLVAYWKFDEGKGDTIKDYTHNKNHGKADSSLKWIAIQLPEMSSSN